MSSVNITCFLAQTLDGAIARSVEESSSQRRRTGWSSARDFELLLEGLQDCDAVFMGGRTLLSERGAFRTGRPGGEPTWVLFTRGGQDLMGHALFQQEGIAWQLATLVEDAPSGFQWATPPGDWPHTLVSPRAVQAWCQSQGWRRVALLGGGELNGFFLKHGLVDRLILSVFPILAGTRRVPGAFEAGSLVDARFRFEKCQVESDHLQLHYVLST